jgi:putative ABC transport system substrate-binding protein
LIRTRGTEILWPRSECCSPSNDVGSAFDKIVGSGIDALIVGTTSSLLGQRKQLVDSAARARVPAIYARREYAEAGGLISYGSDTQAVFTRGADYVDRILRGSKPADLPFEMAATFTLVLNLKSAQALGLSIPNSVRLRADEVIE